MLKKLLLLFLILAVRPLSAQSLLQSGPMVGYAAMREVMLWVQTKSSAQVHFEYWEAGKPEKRWSTEPFQTQKAESFVAHVRAEVEPGISYQYELFINGKLEKRPYPLRFQSLTLWQWRTDAPDFKFVLGSCAYVNEPVYDRPGNPYGGDQSIYLRMAERNPQFMLWLGDNVYLRETDWDSETGIMKRYAHTRAVPELQPLLGAAHHYAIWDDHDYGSNNADRTYPLKETTLTAFKRFWANPNYGQGNTLGKGITGTFSWSDAQFFLLDNRFFRTPNERVTGERAILGKEQAEWLIDALKSSEALFKFVAIGGQFLNPCADKENHSRYIEEQQYILQRIRQERIEGVIFLTGDRHYTVLTKMQEVHTTYPLYDLTVSALTSGSSHPYTDINVMEVPNTFFTEHNFGEIEVQGKGPDRTLTIRIIDKTGKLVWEKAIKASELRYPKG